MKKLLFVYCCITASFSVYAQNNRTQQKNPPPLPGSTQQVTEPVKVKAPGKFKFTRETYDFGEILDGPLAECDFVFKNIGKSPIVITEAHGSCGCTVPQWPKDSIKPKHKGVIHVVYKTYGRVGPIDKDIFITSNASQNPMKLHLTGTVKPNPANENKPAPLPVVPPATDSLNEKIIDNH